METRFTHSVKTSFSKPLLFIWRQRTNNFSLSNISSKSEKKETGRVGEKQTLGQWATPPCKARPSWPPLSLSTLPSATLDPGTWTKNPESFFLVKFFVNTGNPPHKYCLPWFLVPNVSKGNISWRNLNHWWNIFINIPVSTFYLSVGPGVDEGADKWYDAGVANLPVYRMSKNYSATIYTVHISSKLVTFCISTC